jgi:hypothetical protein
MHGFFRAETFVGSFVMYFLLRLGLGLGFFSGVIGWLIEGEREGGRRYMHAFCSGVGVKVVGGVVVAWSLMRAESMMGEY